MHVFLGLETTPSLLPLTLTFPAAPLLCFVTDIERRPGEMELPYILTRVGEEERVRKALDDANPEEDDCDELRVLQSDELSDVTLGEDDDAILVAMVGMGGEGNSFF